MSNPELIIIGLNVVIMFIAYFFVYPKFCGANGIKIAINDLIASVVVLVIAGSMFWSTGQQFSLVLFSVNWFWFTLITYFILEIPLMLWYDKKYDVWSSLKNYPDKD